ncbi:MAG: hypothetical protein NVSMB33_11130 [Ktedonobacteraceae bacterium]
MTQDSGRRPINHKRSSRAGRNRPLLVTSTENATNGHIEDDVTPTVEESVAEVQAQNPPIEPGRRRLPNFFSTVGKVSQEPTTQEKEIAQARITRATRNKPASAKTSIEGKSEGQVEPGKATAKPAKPSVPARPASPFKTRYLIGMGLYLLCANFIGIFETQYFQANHLDRVLTQFPLFGGLIIIRTSTLAFLATLIIILVLLARFDLIPRSFSAMSGRQTAVQRNKRSSSTSNNNTQNNPDGMRPPTMRQGVKGADDELYKEYRTNQRRKK